MKNRMPTLLLLLCFLALLLLYPAQAADAGRAGIALCLELIVPSLFPFFVFSSLLVSLGLAELLGRLLRGFMEPLFHLPGSAATPLLLGLLGGYPVGIRTASDLYAAGQCSRESFLRLCFFCNNCGPAFLLSVAGIGMSGSKSASYLLLGTHWAAAILLAFLSRALPTGGAAAPAPPRERACLPFSSAFPESVREAFSSTLHVCAFVILFTVLIALAEASGALGLGTAALGQVLPTAFDPALCRSLLIGVFELSTGTYALAQSVALPLALPLCAFILAWGGLSVHCQSLPYLNRCPGSAKPYFCGKLLHGLISALLVALLAPLLAPEAAPAVAAGFWSAPAVSLLRQEMLALWLLAGAFFLLSGKKAGKRAAERV